MDDCTVVVLLKITEPCQKMVRPKKMGMTDLNEGPNDTQGGQTEVLKRTGL
jgi:hypothetical protein